MGLDADFDATRDKAGVRSIKRDVKRRRAIREHGSLNKAASMVERS